MARFKRRMMSFHTLEKVNDLRLREERAQMNDMTWIANTATICGLGNRVIPLVQRWHIRRQEALDALETAFRYGPPVGQGADTLASHMHKLAGTAGLFGEYRLGDAAGRLERALRNGQTALYSELLTEIRNLAQHRGD